MNAAAPAPLTVADVLHTLDAYPTDAPLPAPPYALRPGPKVMLAVPSMQRHMSDEGWQLALALRGAGYELYGHGLPGSSQGRSDEPPGTTNTAEILRRNPSVVFVQDQHEWDTAHFTGPSPGHLALPEEYFYGAPSLAERPDVFKLTVVKDTHRQYASARDYSAAIGTHAWVVYYHPAIVLRTLSWLRPQHVIRTYHTVDPSLVPPYRAEERLPCLLSGSLGGAYPLRTRIHAAQLDNVTFLPHPGYNNTGSHTPAYLRELSRYRVALCTASKFGYALRKLIEATACGCRVVTDLPSDEVLPEIDGNLVRVHPNIGMRELKQLLVKLCEEYNPDFQESVARAALARYDYWAEGVRLAAVIDRLRSNY